MRFQLGCLLACAACDSSPGESEDPPRIQDPIPAPAFRIDPANPVVISSGSLQFRAIDSSGNPVPVFWRLADSELGQISTTGVFAPCYGAGQTQIRALPKADTTKAASTGVTILQQTFGIVSITALTNPVGPTVVKLDSVAGTIDVEVAIAAGQLTCKQVVGSRLELLAAGTTTRLDSVRFSRVRTANFTHTFRWNTAAIANGAYNLRGVLVFPSYEYAGSEIPVVVRNP